MSLAVPTPGYGAIKRVMTYQKLIKMINRSLPPVEMTIATRQPERNWAAITIISTETLPLAAQFLSILPRHPCHFEGEDSAAINIRISFKLSALSSTEKPAQLMENFI